MKSRRALRALYVFQAAVIVFLVGFALLLAALAGLLPGLVVAAFVIILVGGAISGAAATLAWQAR
jgi:hypothetical protein